MKKELDLLGRIEALPEPRHLFILPDWVDPQLLDRLIQEGYITCHHNQRTESGVLNVVMGMRITAKGDRLLHPAVNWRQLVVKGSLAGASFTAMSLLILYLG
jgi:hypothetical protein